MAKKDGEDMGAEGTALEHNSQARADYQDEQFREWYRLECELAAAKEKHVKPIQDDITELRRSMKADLDMHQKDIKLAFSLYKRSREAEDFEDEGEGDKIHDSLRELFANLRKGGQLNFMDAIEGGDDDPRPSFLKEQTEAKDAEEADADA